MPSASPSLVRFYSWNLGLPVLLAAAVFLAFDLTELDIAIADLLFDREKGAFVWQASYWVERALHQWAREIPNAVSGAAMIGSILSLVWKPLKPYRRDLFFVFVAMSLSAATVSGVKRLTDVECPIGIINYGGSLPHEHWWQRDKDPEAIGKRCWPAGHATAGFTLLALYFVTLRRKREWARKVLAFGLCMGMFYGTSRMLQGWHFMSHTLWAGIIVWTMTFLTALGFYGPRLLMEAQQVSRE